MDERTWSVAGEALGSRLILGSGGFGDLDTFSAALAASGSAMVTVALRRIDQAPPGLLDAITQGGARVLPNTAGCYTADDAIRTAHLAREALETDWLKLEVIGHEQTLLPDPVGTLEAATALAAEGFKVFPYTGDDPILAQRLEQAGCVAVMPLGSPIGSGLGILNPHAISLLREAVSVPVVLDAGIGTASDAALAMELGCDAILAATAISRCADPVRMAGAFDLAVRAGWLAARSGRVPRRRYAHASTSAAGLPDLGPGTAP
ncbi:MAG: thiazole synthase [Gaiellales bacterium]